MRDVKFQPGDFVVVAERSPPLTTTVCRLM